jgi:hypothetical protein
MASRTAATASGVLTIVVAVAGAIVAGAQQVPQQPPRPTFRTGVTIVPVDVRVLDRDGKPITDLEQGDFTVLEDGAPQDIRYFSARGHAPRDRRRGAGGDPRSTGEDDDRGYLRSHGG